MARSDRFSIATPIAIATPTGRLAGTAEPVRVARPQAVGLIRTNTNPLMFGLSTALTACSCQGKAVGMGRIRS